MERMCYLNGRILPLSEAKVGLYDIGMLRGFGIYEALTTFGRRPFRFADHMERFRRSAEVLRIDVPMDDDELMSAMQQLIRTNVADGKEAVIRVVLTGGEAIEGIRYKRETPTLYIVVEELIPPPSEVYEKGACVTVFDFQRQFPLAKTTNYIQAVLLQEDRIRAGAIEILYTAGAKILECATSNFFLVKGNVVITAKDCVLLGITRKVALELARKEFQVEERDVALSELESADEAFLTSSFKDIVPIVKAGDKQVGDGRVGPVTKRLIELFDQYAHSS